MKILIDFFPILLFFGAYKMFNIYTATGVLMAATVLQMGLIYAIDRKLQAMHKITLVLILLFGTLTLVLQDDRFIKWKPTVLYGAMAVALAVVAALGVWLWRAERWLPAVALGAIAGGAVGNVVNQNRLYPVPKGGPDSPPDEKKQGKPPLHPLPAERWTPSAPSRRPAGAGWQQRRPSPPPRPRSAGWHGPCVRPPRPPERRRCSALGWRC